jgi:hypothetical protein
VVIKVFFSVLVLCTVAVVAVVLAIHFRVKRHLRPEGPPTSPESGLDEVEGQIDTQVRPVIESAATGAADENRPKQAS